MNMGGVTNSSNVFPSYHHSHQTLWASLQSAESLGSHLYLQVIRETKISLWPGWEMMSSCGANLAVFTCLHWVMHTGTLHPPNLCTRLSLHWHEMGLLHCPPSACPGSIQIQHQVLGRDWAWRNSWNADVPLRTEVANNIPASQDPVPFIIVTTMKTDAVLLNQGLENRNNLPKTQATF